MIDVGALLEKVEAAAPIDAVEAVAAELGEMVDASDGLPADRRLQRPGRRPADLGRAGRRRARPRGRAGGDRSRWPAPCTSRCCAPSGPTSRPSAAAPGWSCRSPTAATRSGVLELVLPRAALRERGRRHAGRRARAGLRRHRRPPAHRPVRVGAALHALRPGRGDPAPAAAGVLHLRGGAVHPRRLAGAGQHGGRGHLRLHPGPRVACSCRSPTPSATRSRPHCWPRCSSAGCATAAARGMDLAEQAAYANDSLADHARARAVRHRPAAARRPARPARRASSTPGTPSRCGCATAGWRRSPLRVEPPFGVVPGKAFELQPFPLEPGDRIVFLTDGMQERNAVDLDVAAALADTADLHPREVVHALGAAVLQRDRRRPPGRRHDGLPGLVRRAAAGPHSRAGRRPEPRLGGPPEAVAAARRSRPGNLGLRCASTGPAGPSSPSHSAPPRLSRPWAG